MAWQQGLALPRHFSVTQNNTSHTRGDNVTFRPPLLHSKRSNYAYFSRITSKYAGRGDSRRLPLKAPPAKKGKHGKEEKAEDPEEAEVTPSEDENRQGISAHA
eukprot:g7424.t1